jgi:hypothetical protein
VTLTKRLTKGSKLTHAEMDANLDHLGLSENHSFTQAGSGAMDRNVQSRLRDWVSVFDFMTAAQIADVKAQTVTQDVTSAIQATIDSLSTTGGVVYLPPGIYKTTSSLTLTNAITLQGSGFNKNTSRIYPTSAVSIAIKNANWDLAGDNSQITIRDLSIAPESYGDIDRVIALQGFWLNLENLKFEGADATSGCLLLKDGQYATLRNIIGLGHSAPGTVGAGSGIVIDNFDNVFGVVDVEGFAIGIDLLNDPKSCNLVARCELNTQGIRTTGDDHFIHGTFSLCDARWLNVTSGSNNRFFVSRDSDTSVPANPVILAAGASGNWVFTDESVTANNTSNFLLGAQFQATPGSVSAPGITFVADPQTGFFWLADGAIEIAINGSHEARITGTQFRLASDQNLSFSSGAPTAAADVLIGRGAADVLQLASGDSFRPADASGQTLGDSSHTWRVYHDVVATASLPAAGSSMDGAILIEDAGAGNRNLIVYAGGERFRIDGGAAF